LPGCRFLFLGGAETLDGIEAFPQLQNLILNTPAETFEPLAKLPQLTCLTVHAHEPTDVSPLARVPQLQFLSLDTMFTACLRPPKPRDVMPLVESITLRELHVRGSKVIETEAAAVQTGLPSWNDLYLRHEPRPIPPHKLRAVPWKMIDQDPGAVTPPIPADLPDLGLRECELRWAMGQLSRAITRKMGTSDWGEAEIKHEHRNYSHPHILKPTGRSLSVEFQSFGLIDQFPVFVEAIRECLAWLKNDYVIHLGVHLKAPKPVATPAQIEMERKFRDQESEAYFEQRQRDNEAYLERLHRYELKKQDGSKVNPEEFGPDPRAPRPKAPWEDDEEGIDIESGDVAIKEKPDPPPSWLDDEHPLADNYNLIAYLRLDTFSVGTNLRDIAEYLMHRACDEVIEEPKAGEQ
jgi:hypothetical protein